MSVTHIVMTVKSQQVTLDERADHKNTIVLMAFCQILETNCVKFILVILWMFKVTHLRACIRSSLPRTL